MAFAKTTNYFQWNTCNTICDRTGFKVKLSDTTMEWDGYRILKEVWETRQPQDFQVTPRPAKTYSEARFRPTDKVYTAPDPLNDFPPI